MGLTRIADTSFLLALFDAEDRRHPLARRLASEPDPIEVPAEVLGETLGVAHRRRGFAAAWGIWTEMAKIPHVRLLGETDLDATARRFEDAKGRLSWVDATVVARCKARGAEPLCFDDDIEAAVVD